MPNYKKTSSNIEELIISAPKNGHEIKWLNIINAGKKEIDYLRKSYNFNLPHLKASISTVFSQRPMVSQEKDYLFIILHFPISVNGKVIAGEIEFFIGHGYMVTVHNRNIPALNNFFQICKNNAASLIVNDLESSIILLYELLDKLINDCYSLIDKNSVSINQVEDMIFAQRQMEAVTLILNLRRNLINLRKILQNHQDILRRLTLVKSSLVPQNEIQKHYDKLIEHSGKIWAMLENQKEMIEVLNSTNESLLNDRMTNIMKTLTIFSVIVFPLTLLAAIFGMNAEYMPFVEEKNGFWTILAIMFCCSMVMLWFFKKKRWI